jgi:negative regulator of genetic competence, sporulation and motility
MDYLVINENKLKIMMSAEDMREYGIDAEASDYDNPAVRRSFWRILDAARDACGFSVSGDKLLIQFYPSGSGSELFVTKLGRIGGGAERNLSNNRNVAMLTSKYSIYRFDTLSDLKALSQRLGGRVKDIKSDAYLGDDGAYYLIIEERSVSGQISDFALLCEYGTELPYSMIPYVLEHSRLVSKDNATVALAKA